MVKSEMPAIPRDDLHVVFNSNALPLQQIRDTVRAHGICFVTDVPVEIDFLETFVEYFGTVHVPATYPAFYDIDSSLSEGVANNKQELPPHTDDPYEQHPPEIIFMHCICNRAEGGDCTYVDGLKVARDLHENDPKSFEVLCSVEIPYEKRFGGVSRATKAPQFVRNSEGCVTGVRVNPFYRGKPEVDHGMLEIINSAQAALNEQCTRPENMIKKRLQAGNLVILDNSRILHGRTEISGTNKRLLRYCSMSRTQFCRK